MCAKTRNKNSMCQCVYTGCHGSDTPAELIMQQQQQQQLFTFDFIQFIAFILRILIANI